jgi:hypothetical protein
VPYKTPFVHALQVFASEQDEHNDGQAVHIYDDEKYPDGQVVIHLPFERDNPVLHVKHLDPDEQVKQV